MYCYNVLLHACLLQTLRCYMYFCMYMRQPNQNISHVCSEQCWRTGAKSQPFLTAEVRTPYVANIIWQPSVVHWVYWRCTHRKYTVYIISIMLIENSINTVLLHYVTVYQIGMEHRNKRISKCFYFSRIYKLRNYSMLH